MWGILEVAIDTVVVCTLSGVVVLAAGPWQSGATGSALLSLAFRAALGLPGQWIVALSLAAFAFSTFLGWSHYGEQCLRYLGGARFVSVYRLIFTAAVALGAVMTLDLAWALSDVLNGLMIPPNLVSLILLSPEVLRLTRERFRHTPAD
jgi:AGCS family alanine or glycine:cation symporter